MPLVTVRVLKGALDQSERQTIQQRITDVMVDVEGRGKEAFRQYVWVIIVEEEPSNWSVGGQPLSLEGLDAVRGSP